MLKKGSPLPPMLLFSASRGIRVLAVLRDTNLTDRSLAVMGRHWKALDAKLGEEGYEVERPSVFATS